MANRFVLLFYNYIIILLLEISFNVTQDLESPCPRLFVYETPRIENDRWYGIVTLLTDADLSGVWLRLTFDNTAIQIGNWFGNVKTEDNKGFLIANRDYKLLANTPTPVRFYVRYDPSQPIPKLINIRLNARQICPEGQVASTSSAPPQLYTNKEIEAGPATSPVPLVVPTPSNAVSKPPPLPVKPPNIGLRYDKRCGRPSPISAKPLILYGESTVEGEWPWHIALYKNERGISQYICGGSLISNSYIVTAAHCVANPDTGEAERPTKFIIYIGTTSINILSSNVQIGQVAQIRIYPEYNRDNFHNDIAVLKTVRPFQYTDSVKPVCLWEGDDELNKVVGSLGTVVGWGLDENVRISEQLMKTRMPIVDSINCIYSNRDFFAKYTTLKSYCAGFRNGSGVCNGDSGSGMVIEKRDNDGQSSWYLRGLVSVSVPSEDRSSCNLDHYVVFTDVAKYVSWIKRIMESI